MKSSMGFLLVLLALPTAASDARTFTTEQQAVIDQVRRCNDAWTASVAERRYEIFSAACPHEEGALWWYPDVEPGPFRAVWENSVRLAGITWRDLEPVAVTIDGDLALVYYVVTWSPTAITGETAAFTTRRLTVMRLREGAWVQMGGSIAPIATPPPAQPPTGSSPD
jgi:hypothetical protein